MSSSRTESEGIKKSKDKGANSGTLEQIPFYVGEGRNDTFFHIRKFRHMQEKNDVLGANASGEEKLPCGARLFQVIFTVLRKQPSFIFRFLHLCEGYN